MDSFNGQTISRREFNGEASLVNLALSNDGRLVYTIPNQLACKDLFEPGDKTTFVVTSRREQPPAKFAGMENPDQLLISEGRILALSDGE